MHVKTLLNTGGLTDRDFDQIFEIAGTRVPHDVGKLDRHDLEIAFGRGTVFFVARVRSDESRQIHGLATLCPVHIGIRLEGIVMNVIVPSPYRGKQIGVRLVEKILDHAVKARFGRLILLHPCDEPDADRVFREHSFEIEEAEWLYVHRKQR